MLQKTSALFDVSIIIVDNDLSESARAVVRDLRPSSQVDMRYCVEPRRNIALARNRAVAQGSGTFVAFIDDDEMPGLDWLLTLYRGLQACRADGVLGPVLPHFEAQPPRWVAAAGFYERPRHSTGYVLRWYECRTGNALLRRKVLESLPTPFRWQFGTGGEDQDFFRRAIEKGHRFVWCDDAIVQEIVPPQRWKRKFLLRRALLRGQNSARHSSRQYLNLGKSVIAIPIYCLILPVLLLAGQHRFMKYLVKLTDHVGRVLATLGFHPVAERPM